MNHNFLRNICICSLFIVYGLSCVTANAEHKLDSLLAVLKIQKEDSNKAATYVRVLSYLAYAKTDTTYKLDSELLHLAENLRLSPDSRIANFGKKAAARAYVFFGHFYGRDGNINAAIENSEKALLLFKELNNQRGIADAYTMLGASYNDGGDYPKAIDNYYKALEIDEKVADADIVSTDLGNVGTVYYSEGNYKETLNFFYRALAKSIEAKDKVTEARHMGNIANVYIEQEQYDSAAYYAFNSEQLNEEIGDKYQLCYNLVTLGSLYSAWAHKNSNLKNAYDTLINKSFYYTEKSINAEEESGTKEILGISLLNMGCLYEEKKDYEKAKEYVIRAITIADSMHSLMTKKEAYKTLSMVYEETKEYQNALDAYKKYSVLNDSLFNADKNKEITRNEVSYEFKKKEADLKAQQDKKDAVAAEEKKKQGIIIYAVSTVLLLVLLLAGFILRGYKQKQKANLLLEEQKQKVDNAYGELREKHKEITDSINYAKRIQRALFKSEEYVSRQLPEHFILFKPKDVVSGDFYWGYEKKDFWYVAAVDCTGHGVPGAFLTMLGSAFLNEICSRTQVLTPAEILNHLTEKIIKELSGYGEVKDGMDISLCRIPLAHSETVKVQWAGANNPLWYMHQNTMHEIIADKQPIGYQEGNKPFVNREVELNRGDVVYLFTDGYADQFGGPKGKKYKFRQLQEKLKTVSEKPLNEQKEILMTEFDSWKGNLEQTDDMCIIGIRI